MIIFNTIFKLLLVISIIHNYSFAQQIHFDANNHSANRSANKINFEPAYNKIYEYNYVENKPIYQGIRDSLNDRYISQFFGFDSLATRCINNGDTAKYIRVHFEFIVDQYGIPYDGTFDYVGSTRYSSSNGDKKLKYFDDLKDYFNRVIKKMIKYAPIFKPAIQNNVPVSCYVKDYFQFWLGINPEAK